ncbi:MAG: BlaI/MecI/CopY family transcriptional regulator [Candidatus Micrarchaeota archaeon]
MDTKDRFKSVSSPALREKISADLQQNLEKFRDPVVLGELMFQLLEERENTNRILKNILQRLEAIEKPAGPEEPLLPELDEKIMDFVRKRGKATAEEVQAEFGYRGRNGASSRLNRLCMLGMLAKRQAGRKVFFLPQQ